jgi:ABC-2 type transport system ATP-binding protein
MQTIVSISNLSKTYKNGHQALKCLNLDIKRGEILALLGPNGAGKTTLISIICGLVNATTGSVTVDGDDIITDFRSTRSKIGLVPQELTLGAFDKVINTLVFSRGLFGKKANPAYLEQLLKSLSLWDKRYSEILALSGGMKRRVLIGKALAHEPLILFLDEPTAGVDVELRKDMWALVRKLRETGVTIILTTHYIAEAEAIADRVGVINNGELLLVDDKRNIMHTLGKKQMTFHLRQALSTIPESLSDWALELADHGRQLIYNYDPNNPRQNIDALLQAINNSALPLNDINTSQSSLEDIFVRLINNKP